jgi:hypothetical protein
MKTLAQRLQQIPPSISRAFRDYRYAFRSWLHAAASQLFPVPAPVPHRIPAALAPPRRSLPPLAT